MTLLDFNLNHEDDVSKRTSKLLLKRLNSPWPDLEIKLQK